MLRTHRDCLAPPHGLHSDPALEMTLSLASVARHSRMHANAAVGFFISRCTHWHGVKSWPNEPRVSLVSLLTQCPLCNKEASHVEVLCPIVWDNTWRNVHSSHHQNVDSDQINEGIVPQDTNPEFGLGEDCYVLSWVPRIYPKMVRHFSPGIQNPALAALYFHKPEKASLACSHRLAQ